MSEDQKPASEPTPEQIHQSNKIVRQGLAFAHHTLTYKPHVKEECLDYHVSVDVLEKLCKDLQQKIELVEPPAAPSKEPKKPYLVDVPMAPPSSAIESSGHADL